MLLPFMCEVLRLLYTPCSISPSSLLSFFALCLHSFAASLTTFVVVVAVASALFATCLLLCFCYCATHSEADENEDEGRRCLSVFAAGAAAAAALLLLLLLSCPLATCCAGSDVASLLLLFLLIIGFNEFHNCFAFGLLMISSSSSSASASLRLVGVLCSSLFVVAVVVVLGWAQCGEVISFAALSLPWHNMALCT